MPLPKQCELCEKIYQCRRDKINTSRFCSRLCTNKNAGIVCRDNRNNRWASDTKEEVLCKMKQSFEKLFTKAKEGCWLWNTSRKEYSSFSFRGISRKSNRASWLIYRGEIPKGLYVLHTCDIRKCVNPDHLFLGTHADNMKDMALKKRARPRSKLTEDQVVNIRQLLKMGVSTVRLARDYHVTSTCIWYIKHNKSWIIK